MPDDKTDEHRKTARRSGLEMRKGGERRQEEPESWAYFEKRTGKTRRDGTDRREHAERRHPAEKDA